MLMEQVKRCSKERTSSASTMSILVVAGGLILNLEGTQMNWKFGPLMNPINDARAKVICGDVATQFANDDKTLTYLAKLVEPYSYSWNVFKSELVEREVGWVAEGNFCIRVEVFKQIQGFDAAMRYHETHDLNKRIQDLGGKTKFIPDIVAKHLAINVRGEHKEKEGEEAMLYYYQKHWGMDKAIFDKCQAPKNV
jgi:GT2 family glycosyltransferase